MFDPSKYTVKKAKPLPVILLLDVSTSMAGPKIDTLNKAVEKMIDTFSDNQTMEIEIQVAVITFGKEVNLVYQYEDASKIDWVPLETSGMTPMGTALRMAKDMIEDKTVTPTRVYRPTVILVSDGQPKDDWKKPLDDFISNGRSSKCFRMSMAIGHDADEDILKKFAQKDDFFFYAEKARDIHSFFEYVTMSVTSRSKSENPNEVPNPSDLSFDGSDAEPLDDDEGLWE